MTQKIVLVFSGPSANDAISGLMTEWANMLIADGLSVVHIAQEPDELQFAVDQISSGNVAFGLTWLGILQDLKVSRASGAATTNLWETFRLPLLKMHGDLPAYFTDRHRDFPSTSVNLYHGAEFLEYRRKWIPEAKAIAARLPPVALFPIEKAKVDFKLRRMGKLVFLKNGNSPAALRASWNNCLPKSVAKLVTSMSEEIARVGLRSAPLDIGDFVSKVLESEGTLDTSVGPMFHFFAAQMDDYLRRVKSEMIAKAIMDLPVIVQGGHWDHLDFRGRRATLVEGKSYSATAEVFATQLGIVDMSPNTQSFPHDRMQRAAGSFAGAITNRQDWLMDAFPECGELCFDFTPESIASTVAWAIDHPEHFQELGESYGRRYQERYRPTAFVDQIVKTAELASIIASEAKPQPQPFFGWPR